jgi:hypothetical protein
MIKYQEGPQATAPPGIITMAPVYRHPKRPIEFHTCTCEMCAAHMTAIDQLAEKVAIGASEEVKHWTGVSWTEIVISDWQDIMGKKKQAYWHYKSMMNLASDNQCVISLEKVCSH